MRWRSSGALALGLALVACAGPRLVSDTPVRIGLPYQVRGRWYVPADDRGYEAVGYASWYGGEHRGNRTANGERFEPARISAAHTTLPLPSYIEVTSLDSGRRLIVRVNDRGPFGGDRLIDLSRGAADRLSLRPAGRAAVAIRRVFPAEADRRRLRSGRPAAQPPDATPTEIARLRAQLAAPSQRYGALSVPGLSGPPQD